MKIVACMPVRNEEWCLGVTLQAALLWCDTVVCADHGSTDRSREIMEALAAEHGRDRVIIRDDGEVEWHEMEQRQLLLETARAVNATHIAIVDADEIVTANMGRFYGMRDIAINTPAGHILQLPGYNLRNGLDHYHGNGLWAQRLFSVTFRDDPSLHWKGDRFHHREPMGGQLAPYRPMAHGVGGIMHLWGASERRLKAKHALYKVTERLRWPSRPAAEIDRMYSMWRSPADAAAARCDSGAAWWMAPVPSAWWNGYESLGQIDLDGEPWQEAETRRLIEDRGAEYFAGLDLFGVA